jgi:multiple sugar transport system substrate-binding protein
MPAFSQRPKTGVRSKSSPRTHVHYNPTHNQEDSKLPIIEDLGTKTSSAFSRRNFLGAAAGIAAIPLLAACSTGASAQTTKSKADTGPKNLIFSTPTDAVATIALFNSFASSFQSANKGSKVSVIENGAGSFDQWLQAHLAAGNAPDVLRITPTQIGTYIANGGMLDISSYLPKNYSKDFNPTFWSQVDSAGGKVFGLPQCVDTTALFYRKSMLAKVGARIPKSPADAWTWDEFLTIAAEVKKLTGKYAFSFQWTAGSGYYWLPILYQAGGALAKSDNKTPTMSTDEGIAALEFTKKWYDQGLVSPSNTLQGTIGDDATTLFTTGQAGMMINGDWKLTNVKAGGLPEDDWDVTYYFKDKQTASLVGGTIIGVTRDAKNPEFSAQLAQWMVSKANMKKYCEETLFLPARESLSGTATEYSYRPDAVARFLEQAAAIPKEMYKLQTSPNFAAMNNVLSQQIPLCFTGQQSAKETAANIDSGIKSALSY